MGLSLLDKLEVQYTMIKKQRNPDIMMVPKLRFSRGLKAKAPGAVVTACVPAATPFVEIFMYCRYPLNTRSNDGEGEDFLLPLRVFQVYDCFFTVLTERSCFEVLLTADSQCFTSDDTRTLVPTIPRRRRAFIVSLNIEVFIHSCEQCGHFFFHQAPPSPVSSPSQSPPSFPSPPRSTRRNPLSPRSPSSWKPSNVQLVPAACVASGNIHNAVSRHLNKNRAKHRPVFSMNKAQESKQRSTIWRRRHLGDMQQQPRRWPGFDKCVETKFTWTYIYVLGHRHGRFCDVYMLHPIAGRYPIAVTLPIAVTFSMIHMKMIVSELFSL